MTLGLGYKKNATETFTMKLLFIFTSATTALRRKNRRGTRQYDKLIGARTN